MKKRIEGNVREVSTRTKSLDKEIFPSLCAKLYPGKLKGGVNG